MGSATARQIKVKVHLLGAIAYVPDPDGRRLWALFPNGQRSEPAPWAGTTQSQFLTARSPHFPLLVADRGSVDVENTTETFLSTSQVFDPDQIEPGSLFPLTAAPKAISLVAGKGLSFGLDGNGVKIKKAVNKFVPKMRKIAPLHSSVDDRYRPESEAFDRRMLSSAFCMNSGVVSVGGYFVGEDDDKVDFGFVSTKSSGELEFNDIVWKKRVANHLIWKFKLPAGEELLSLESANWKDGSPRQYIFRPVNDGNRIELAILNSEAEVPTLFLSDAILPDKVGGFPDPDFALFYQLSVNGSQSIGRRYPTPRPESTGRSGKPCAGGMFVGFA